jgi:ankyrin repeat protein
MDPSVIIPTPKAHASMRYNHRIHYFSKIGNLERVHSYLQNGIDVNIRGPFGRTPLHYACQYGHIEIVHLLLHKGADIDICDQMGGSPILEAITYSRYNIVQILLNRGCMMDNRAEDIARENKDFKMLELIELPLKSALDE